VARPERLLPAIPWTIPRFARDQTRGRAFVQLGVIVSVEPGVAPELSNSPTTNKLMVEERISHGKHEH
jgi:hypothetical protein